jgi:hypothetical protein
MQLVPGKSYFISAIGESSQIQMEDERPSGSGKITLFAVEDSASRAALGNQHFPMKA